MKKKEVNFIDVPKERLDYRLSKNHWHFRKIEKEAKRYYEKENSPVKQYLNKNFSAKEVETYISNLDVLNFANKKGYITINWEVLLKLDSFMFMTNLVAWIPSLLTNTTFMYQYQKEQKGSKLSYQEFDQLLNKKPTMEEEKPAEKTIPLHKNINIISIFKERKDPALTENDDYFDELDEMREKYIGSKKEVLLNYITQNCKPDQINDLYVAMQAINYSVSMGDIKVDYKALFELKPEEFATFVEKSFKELDAKYHYNLKEEQKPFKEERIEK